MDKQQEARREAVQYLFWGVMTTLVNYGAFWLLTRLTGGELVLLCNAFTFVLATAFAFVTNKIFVFRSRSWAPGFVLREGMTFTGARLFSFGIEEAGLWLVDGPLALGDRVFFGLEGIMIAKIALSFLAVILNYFFSKLLVFRKGGTK